jgi:hypothetical protein
MEQALTAIGFLFLGILVGAFGMARFAFTYYKRGVCKLPRERRIQFENLAIDYQNARLDPDEFPNLAQIVEDHAEPKAIISLLLTNATKLELAAAYHIVIDAYKARQQMHTLN